jgi:hypothetical protein
VESRLFNQRNLRLQAFILFMFSFSIPHKSTKLNPMSLLRTQARGTRSFPQIQTSFRGTPVLVQECKTRDPSRTTRRHSRLRGTRITCKQQPEKVQILKYTKYVKVVSKAFGVDLDAYIVPAVALAFLLLIVGGFSSALIIAATAFAIIVAFAAVFLSFGWLFIPVLLFMGAGAVVAGAAGFASLFLLLPFGIMSAVGLLAFTLSKSLISRMDEDMATEALQSLDEDGRFSEWELERFDARLKRRNPPKF